ncbi:hypothetical protein R5W23_005475 [Gemmata sp. JC673]|uniref:Uncharacterized protein n=1 Tax=Gemmata algarum TaxID=2975278 RepID=A0ABU5ESR3_9BACT|nr:hypothetical protein [Gemmata algarum]MDY3558382.1 hypothetical protein [Gemmata algarum]
MSTLFNIRVELVAGPTAWARFEVCHPDQWDVPATKAIALLVVVEVYREMKEGFGFHRTNRPMSRSEAAGLVTQHPARERLDRWLDLYMRFDGPAFAATAEEAIAGVELTGEDGNPKRAEGDPDPRATMVFTARDAAILSHMTGGFDFDSAMCDCSYW